MTTSPLALEFQRCADRLIQQSRASDVQLALCEYRIAVLVGDLANEPMPDQCRTILGIAADLISRGVQLPIAIREFLVNFHRRIAVGEELEKVLGLNKKRGRRRTFSHERAAAHVLMEMVENGSCETKAIEAVCAEIDFRRGPYLDTSAVRKAVASQRSKILREMKEWEFLYEAFVAHEGREYRWDEFWSLVRHIYREDRRPDFLSTAGTNH